MQEIEIWPYEQMVYAQPRIHPGDWDVPSSSKFWVTNKSPNLGQKIKPGDRQQKKKKKKKKKRKEKEKKK